MIRIGVRTDGNAEIATGHLRRCLTVADALTDRAEVVFYVSDEESAALLRQFSSRFPVYITGTDYRAPKENAADYARPELPELLLVDSYSLTEEWLRFLSGLAPVCYLDDLMLFDYPAALVVNYDPAPPSAFYRSAEQLLAGPQYAPLRPEFAAAGAAYHVREIVRDVLITTGGTDPLDITGRLAEALAAGFGKNTDRRLSGGALSAPLCIHMVSGARNIHRSRLMALAERFPSLCFHENVEDMAALMASCDLAVTAAGTTLCELCAVGVPAVSFCMADNQKTQAAAFDRLGAVPCCTGLPEILHWIHTAAAPGSLDARRAQSARMRTVTDGRGASRIADALLCTAARGRRLPDRTDIP
ncbi:UDP-2,4-diacetamido-2,4,6-trideoxy-beta-L-altropyranose hydrolase [Lachnoclostridium sp. Marseille-P6806]|uniref:UDP-2,4-diacetamido-2,4, 6-trideoxy-beta-L-altropyranose hydrolase n=1 Tax=Lachnoclostridium sp. Marseille-P6806 TaxID=2364793 RepID=UPI0010325E33|nr:UDP-2,4-diacetamido-2,4,6-trideoxy-beta-L-altropyranose hydrolase [Lachnoclostridium sp. Marseille-P6806]